MVIRKGRRSGKATSWPGILPQPLGTAGLRRSVASAVASLVPATPAQTLTCAAQRAHSIIALRQRSGRASG